MEQHSEDIGTRKDLCLYRIQTSKDNSVVSTGTGFVYKVDGSTAYVMTNNHIVVRCCP